MPAPRGAPSSSLAVLVVGAGVMGSLVFAYAKMSRPPAPAPEAPRVAASAGSDAGSDDPCREVVEANAKIRAAVEEKPPWPGVECFVDAKGAWALRLDRWKATGDTEGGMPIVEGAFHVARRVDGRWVDDTTLRTEGALVRSLDERGPSAASVFDFDGDGTPELALQTVDYVHEGAKDQDLFVLTVKNGAIARYPGLPAAAERLEDVDGDGRPDVIYFPYRASRIAPGSGFDFTFDGPAFVAHALPDGSFSRDDAVAKQRLREQCPGADDPATDGPTPEVCARIWGHSAAAALARLAKRCRPPAKKADVCYETPGVCCAYADFERDAKFDPPVTLGAKP